MSDEREPFTFAERWLDQDQLAALGCVAWEGSHLEQLVERAIWSLAGAEPEAGHLLTDRTSMSRKLGLLADFLGLRTKVEDVSRFKEWRLRAEGKKGDGPINKRNVIVHGLWNMEGDTREMLRRLFGLPSEAKVSVVSARPGAKTERLLASELMNVAHELAALYADLRRLLLDAGIEPYHLTRPYPGIGWTS
jgi:hypothetical protein